MPAAVQELDASAILAVAIATVAAGDCTWVDGCFGLRGFSMFGRRFATYFAAAQRVESASRRWPARPHS
jgi:hypothetical protein